MNASSSRLNASRLAACESALHILLMRKPRQDCARSKTSEPWMRTPGVSWGVSMRASLGGNPIIHLYNYRDAAAPHHVPGRPPDRRRPAELPAEPPVLRQRCHG